MKINKLCICIFVVISSILIASVTFAEANVKVMLDGSEVNFDVKPFIKEGRTMVPFRKIFEVLGADVFWNSSTNTVTAKKGSSTIVLRIGQKSATVSGVSKILEVAPQIIGGRTVVPLRFVSENCGAQVDWDSNNNLVSIKNKLEQVVVSIVDASGYQPVTVKKDIPVKLIFRVKSNSDLYGCNRAIVIPEYNISKTLTVGDNVVEFTPKKSGIIPFSCWMGMIESEITVVPK